MSYGATIDNALGIKAIRPKCGPGTYTANATKLPGNPPSGRGRTEIEAKYDLLAKLLWDAAMSNPGRGFGDSIMWLLREATEKDFPSS